MPQIPFLKETIKTGQAPAPVLDTLRRPSYNADRQVAALGRLGRATEPVLLDPNMGNGQYAAINRIGQSVVQAGGIFQALAMEKEKAHQYVEYSKAQEVMENSKAGLPSVLLGKNPNDWERLTRDHLGKTLQSLTANKELSAGARQRIMEYGNPEIAKTATYARVSGDKKIFGDAADMVKVQALRSYRNSNDEEGERILSGGVANQYLSDAEALDLADQGKRMSEENTRKGQATSLNEQARGDPQGFLKEANQNPWGYPTDLVDSAKIVAQRQLRESEITATQAFANRLVIPVGQEGAFKSVEDVDSMLKMTQLQPSDRQALKDLWTKQQSIVTRHSNNTPEGQAANGGALMAEIDRYVPPEGGKLSPDYMNLATRIQLQMGGTLQTTLLKRLNDKHNPPDVPTEPSVEKIGERTLSRWYDEGAFGQIERPAVTGDPEYVEDAPKQAMVPNKATRDSAIVRRGFAEGKWAKFLKDNPNPSEEEVGQALQSIAKGELEPAALAKIYKTTPVTGGTAAQDAANIRRFLGLPPAPAAAQEQGNPNPYLGGDGELPSGNPNDPSTTPPVNLLIPQPIDDDLQAPE